MAESRRNSIADALADIVKAGADEARESGEEVKPAHAKVVRVRDGEVVEETAVDLDKDGTVTTSGQRPQPS